MPLFNSILKEPDGKAPPVERRSSRRYAPNPDFPLKTVLSFVSRDDTGAPMSNSRQGWNWKGRLVDFSEQGARMQLGPGMRAVTGDPCDLWLTIGDFEICVPSKIANIGERAGEATLFGLKHNFETGPDWAAYRQLMEVVALGYTLTSETNGPQPDPSGYLVERYSSDRPARLTLWRMPNDRTIAAFEFLLKDNLVRGAAGHGAEYVVVGGDGGMQLAPTDRALEIHRLLQWVVPNLAPAVPADARDFLRHFA